MTDFEQYIGSFRLYNEVSRTPIAIRYRGTDNRNSQSVAVYQLNAEAAQDPATVQKFLAIGRQAMRLRHANLVQVLEVGEAEGVAYIATQWVREQSLGERLRRSGRTIDVENAVYIIRAVSMALDYAHSEGFVHGHLSPDQIYVTNDNTVLLDGFAEAVRVDEMQQAQPTAVNEDAQARDDALVQQLAFIAPEQARAGQTVDFRADIYSLGAVLYTMIVGKAAFEADDPATLLQQIVDKQPPSPEAVNPALPPAIGFVLQAVLAKEPTARYGSAGEFANAFLQSTRWNVVRTAELATSQSERVPIRIEKPTSRPRRRSFGALALLILIVIALGFIISSAAGIGPLGDRLAQNAPPGQLSLVERLRGLWSSSAQVAIELTTNPVSLTPGVMDTGTLTPTVSSTSTTQAAAVAAASTPTTTAGLTAITPIFNALSNSRTVTVTPDATPLPRTRTPIATPLVALSLTITETLTTTTSGAPSTSASTLVLDPLGLLANVVDVGQVVITGNAAPGSQVQLQINGENSGSTTTRATGTWLFIVTLSDPGAYTVRAQVVNAAGAIQERVQRTITVATLGNSSPISDTTSASATRTAITTTGAITPTIAATSTITATVTVTVTAATATATKLPTATVRPTLTPTVLPTTVPTVRPTATPRPPATATRTPTPRPTATATNTPLPTATNTPLPTATNTPLPTATRTHTPLPTATNTHTPLPTPTATNTPLPTATNTPLPTATNTPLPTATFTNTPLPTATNTPPPTATPLPTATHTPLPTATHTPLPTATNTRPPTATSTPTVTNTPLPTATNTPASGSIEPISPSDGDSANGGERTFTWSATFTPAEDYGFELVFWKPGQNPLTQSIGMAAPTKNLNVTLNLERLDEQLGALFDTGEYNWGVLLVRTNPSYERVQYLGGGRLFIYYRSGGGGDSGSGGPSSGE